MNQVVVMPFPGRGHINPLLNLCHSLSSRSGRETVFTVVVTEEWLQLLAADTKPDNVRFATIPTVIPSELHRGSDYRAFFIAAQTETEVQFERLMDRMEIPVRLIILDASLKWTSDVARRRKIPVAAYWPMSAAMCTMWYHRDLLRKHRHIDVDLSGREEELIDYIPGLSPIKVGDLPSNDRAMNEYLPNLFYVGKNAQALLLTTIYELEPEAINALKDAFQIPIYTLGPNIPSHRLQSVFSSNESNYMSWLDSKPRKTVLYVSLGSFLSVSSAQMDEIAAGLKLSGVNFLWVVRGEILHIKETFGGKGLVVEWCDQLRVLLHSSVGGFWSHCGWNSTKESVFAGVPMLTFPIQGDQPLNSKVIVDDWKIGWKVRKGLGTKSMVKRNEIAELVKRFMDLKSVEMREMIERVKRFQSLCQKSVDECGLANNDIDRFIRDNLGS